MTTRTQIITRIVPALAATATTAAMAGVIWLCGWQDQTDVLISAQQVAAPAVQAVMGRLLRRRASRTSAAPGNRARRQSKRDEEGRPARPLAGSCVCRQATGWRPGPCRALPPRPRSSSAQYPPAGPAEHQRRPDDLFH